MVSRPMTREFPDPVAIFNDRFVFTTLGERDLKAHARVAFGHPTTKVGCLLFSLDEEMKYASFAADHGPLNLAYTIQACIKIHESLECAQARRKPVCLFTSHDPKVKSNMTLVVALYALIVEHRSPWDAFHPIAHMEVMPFRDAGNGKVDHGLSIQDILWGVDKAIGLGLLDLTQFDPISYQYYETVENGDLNLLGPFIPFASPIETAWIKAIKRTTTGSTTSPNGNVAISTATSTVIKAKPLSHGFSCVLDVFEEENVGLVVRLNDELYDKRHFENRGMEHVEMYFDDGTNPSDDIVREFIKRAEEVFSRGQKVAVHCKAGLGRTGVLIGAYLIYKYQFSAQEVIGYMRIVRPGMVVGPQQQYMAMNQMKWAGWAARDQLLRELATEVANQEPVNPLATPPTEINPLLPPVEHPFGDVTATEKQHLAELVTQLQTTSSPSRGRTGTPRPSLVSAPKHGDAAGQPRKSPGRPLKVDVEKEDTPDSVVEIDVAPASLSPRGILKDATNLDRDRYQSREEDASSPTNSQDSMRGTKRGSGRVPLPQIIDRTNSAPPRVTLSVPSRGLLSRSSSNASMSSNSSTDHDPRPPKRRGASGSPLATNGLSSPPTSRETSPASPGPEEMTTDADDLAPLPVSPQLRIPNKLRRRGSPAPSHSIPSTPPPTSVPSSSQDIPHIPEIASPSPTRALPKRSFLPVRRGIALGNFMEPKNITPVPHISPLRERRVTRSAASSRSESTLSPALVTDDLPSPIVHSTPKKLHQPSPASKKVGLTPPRITGMWGQLSRLGSSSPASANGC